MLFTQDMYVCILWYVMIEPGPPPLKASTKRSPLAMERILAKRTEGMYIHTLFCVFDITC